MFTSSNSPDYGRAARLLTGVRTSRVIRSSVMPAWATVSITLGAAAVAVAGTLAATLLQLRHSRREREAAERERWQEKGAEVVAPLLILMADAEPLRLGIRRELLTERMDDLWGRWGFQRNQLTVFAAAHPSAQVGETITEILEAVPHALMDADSFVRDFVGPGVRGGEEARQEARAEAEDSHKRAEKLAQRLLAEVRAVAGPGDEPNAAALQRLPGPQ